MGVRLAHAAACLTAVVLLVACRGETGTVVVDNRIATVQAGTPPQPGLHPMQVTVVADGLPAPTALAALPQGGFLVAARDGGLLQVDPAGTVSPLAGTPATAGGGILDVQPGPGFVANRRIYLAYAEPDPAGAIALAVAWATLDSGGLSQAKVLYRIPAASLAAPPAGASLAFDNRGHMFLGLDLAHGAVAQSGAMPADLLLRLLTDGRIPRDNLWPAGSGVRPEGNSTGHGPIRALAVDPRTGLLWTAEDGGGHAELHLPRFGGRYGPGARGTVPADQAAPVPMPPSERSPTYVLGTPGAPRGLAFLAGAPGSPWAASAFLAGRDGLVRLQLEGASAVTGEELIALEGAPALVDVAIGADRAVYLLTDAPQGRLLRLQPPSQQ